MSNTSIPQADSISKEEFARYLARYDPVIEAISASKGVKNGEKSLTDLDRYRYHDLPDTLGSASSDGGMGLDEVKMLVSWKLRHGKFRPTLMKLVSSNDPALVRETVREAIRAYEGGGGEEEKKGGKKGKKSSAAAALDILSRLRGIGPATASLLLAVHDPQGVVFFADEAFYWLCREGAKGPIKYNAQEYAALDERARALCQRLGVRAIDVERVAYVLLRQAKEEKEEKDGRRADSQGASRAGIARAVSTPATAVAKKPEPQPAKRKKAVSSQDSGPEANAPLRRSKRRAGGSDS